MKKVSRREMQSIQKKALKELKHSNRKSKKSSSIVSTDNGLVFLVSSSMKDLLGSEPFVYQGHERHKHTRFPKIRPISHKVR